MTGRSGAARQSPTGLDTVVDRVVGVAQEVVEKPGVVLIGGCSRSGKTWLANQICAGVKAAGFSCLVIGLDAWIVSLENRGPDSTVLQRYSCKEIIAAIRKLLIGHPIYPPTYDPVTRRRIQERTSIPLKAASGVILLEGVIALALEELRHCSWLNIFVTAPDAVRHERLNHFYHNVKGLDDQFTQRVIGSREIEEVNFIRGTAKWADMIFDGGFVS